MTEDNKKVNITQDIAKARQRLAHSRLLRTAEGFDTAVAQAYYAAFHFARALLLTTGLETKTHSGLIHLINVHFVRNGLLAPEAIRVLASLEGQRQIADYDSASVFTAEMADDAIASARQFGDAVVAHLAAEGYPSS